MEVIACLVAPNVEIQRQEVLELAVSCLLLLHWATGRS